MQGPEDSKAWKSTDAEYRETRTCRECKCVIHVWHCAETGCPWCAKCGLKVNPKKEKK